MQEKFTIQEAFQYVNNFIITNIRSPYRDAYYF